MKFVSATVATLVLSAFAVSAQPPGDECISATNVPVTSLQYQETVNITSYTFNPLDVNSVNSACDLPGRSMWWQFTAPSDGVLSLYTEDTVDTFSTTDLDFNIETFIGSCDNVTRVKCGENLRGTMSVSFPIVRAGETYLIKVGEAPESNNTGNPIFNFTIDFDAYNNLTVSGDECTDAKVIQQTSFPFNEIVDTRLYTNNVNDKNTTCNSFFNDDRVLEPGNGGNTVYYTYTPSSPGILTVDTSGSVNALTDNSLDSVISIFTGSCSDLTEVLCANDFDVETASFLVALGVTYTIRIEEGGNGGDGLGLLNVTLTFQPTYFALIDEDKEEIIGVDLNIDYARIDTTATSMEAVFSKPNNIKSVRLTLDNRSQRSICENDEAYKMFGESGNAGIPFAIGDRVITATAYSGSNCRGNIVGTLSQDFSVRGCEYVQYGLYDGQRDRYITNLYNGSMVSSPPCQVNIGVTFECGFEPDKVRFELRRASNNALVLRRDEFNAPYYLFSNSGSNIASGSIQAGQYVLTAIINNIVHPSVQFTLGTCKASPVVDSTFDIDLRFADGTSLETSRLFQPIVKRLSSLIIGDRPGFTNVTALGSDSACGKFPARIDDLHICTAFVDFRDRGILGFLLNTYTSSVDNLPISGTIGFNTEVFSERAQLGKAGDYILQQLIRTLGLGEYWQRLGLSTGSGAPCTYNGTKAKAEFASITGCTADIPLEQNSVPEIVGFNAFDCLFWDPVCLKNEVLTFTIGEKKISRITLGALEDLGYVVNYTAADPYGINDIGSCTGCNRRNLKTVVSEAPKPSNCHSGIVYERAVRHGRKMLRDVHDHHMEQSKHTPTPEGVQFVGNQRITMTYEHEDGTLCSVVVPADFLF